MISIRNKLNKKFLILLALILALFVPAAYGADVTVNDFNGLKAALADSTSNDIGLGGDIALTETLEISRDVTITGGNHKITATSARHFTITNTASPTFSNLTLDGGSNGGGVDITGTGTVNFNSVTFNANTGTDGGAVAVTGAATVNFTSPTFTSNMGTNGGAVYIYNAGSKVTFDAATFTGNGTTTSTGGAVYVNAATTTPVTFSTSAVFNNNKAANGGALNLIAGATANFTGTATFGDTSTPNTAATNGGAIYSAGNVNFTGAATFKSNTAATSGGAIYINGAASLLTFSSTAAFTSNTADTSGGAIFISGTGGTLTLTDSFTFTGNKTTSTTTSTSNGGGAVYSAGAVAVNSGTFTGNTTTNNGGFIYSGGAVTVSGGTFSTNTAAGSGGVIYAAGAVTVSSGTFESNTATGDGGAVYSGGALTVSGGTFTSNTATGNGGIIASAGSTINISGGTFNGDTIATVNAANGGAIYASSTTSVMTISGGTFEYNTASSSGGAVYSLGTVSLSGVNFTTQNKSQGSATSNGGGAIWANILELNSGTTTFSNQLAENGYGGALFIQDHITVKSGAKAVFSSNEAGVSGGAIRITTGATSTSSFERISFINNTSGSSGGAIYTGSPIEINRCYFTGNKAGSGGGALGVDGSGISVEVASSYFVSNVASYTGTSSINMGGGAIYIYEAGTLDISQTTFAGNSSEVGTGSSKGGAVYTYEVSSRTTLVNNSFYCNTVNVRGSDDGYGGAIHLNEGGSGSAMISFCTFTGNESNGYGGAISLNGGSLSILGSLVVGNTSGLSLGGDVWRNSSATLSSGGDNRLVSYASGESAVKWSVSNGVTGATDDETGSWTAVSFFVATPVFNASSTGLLSFAGSAVGASDDIKLPTIPLDTEKDGAIDKATSTKNSAPATDQVGTTRPQPTTGYPDIGAYEYPKSGEEDDESDNPYANLTIRSIKISGIPNTLSIVGQTAVLHATVTYVGGQTTVTDEPLTWSVTGTDGGSTSIAVIDSSTGSIYTKALGMAIVKVSARNGAYSDSKKLYVVWDMDEANNNIHSTVLNYITQLNANSSNILFYLMATDEAATMVNNSSFQSAFKNKWGTKPTLISFNSSSFGTNSTFKSASVNSFRASETSFNKALTNGITTEVNNQSSGAILPVMCIWNFDISDLAKEFKVDETELDDMTDSAFSKWLFGKINIGFYRTGDKFRPAVSSSNESTLQSSEFNDVVTAEEASNSGALSVQRDDDDVIVSMIAYIANVEPNGDNGSELITSANSRKLLVIPAGTSSSNTSNISGTIWAAEVTTTNNTPSDPKTEKSGGGGGGGGCNTAGLSSALILLASAILLKNKKHA